ncbi:tannase and feruloyl esterase [Colletotrichum plurivorum]|uniref:Carboxylic ester hydrolase n=1 Tax=Colletotrichum plurivorum TaxID=2175906 RepID=A0A8H6K5H9_9PEZI|nr:tannase and feruloyl esterase [Colletotrichum plurivorum]
MLHTFLASIIALAGLASAACHPSTFSFPPILGAEHVQTRASEVRNYTTFCRRSHEAELLPREGIAPFCNVTVSYTHPGHDDSISVYIWLPLDRESWNGVFLGVGGGGFVAGDVDGDAPSVGVHSGHVVATTDAGHPSSEVWGLKEAGNVDWPGFVNFAHRSLHELAVVGKHTLGEFYKEMERKSYFAGCSTGGRQGLALAQRYPGDFDGVLVMCPAVEFPAMVSALYYPQMVMRERKWWPGECELGSVVKAVVEGCDGADGVLDGVVGRLGECRFEEILDKVVGREFGCAGVKGKVDERTVDVVKAVVRGLEDEEGKVMFPGYVPGTPMAGLLGLMNSICADENNREKCEGIPFLVTNDWIRYFIQKDPSFELKTMDLRTYRDIFRQGVEEYDSIIGSSPDLRRFRERGGKVLMWHGMADQCITVTAGRKLYEQAREMDASRGVRTEDYWRYFEVPGVNHCMSLKGNAYPFDALERLRRWVEEGVAPEELEGRKILETEGGKGLGKDVRRICRWPGEGVWDGKGWVCLKPGSRVGVERDEL